MILDEESMTYHPGGRVGFLTSAPEFSRDGDLVAVLNVSGGYVAVYNLRNQSTAYLRVPSTGAVPSHRDCSPGGFDTGSDRFYVLVRQRIAEEAYSDTTYVVAFDIRHQVLLGARALPGSYTFGMVDPCTHLLYLTGPRDPDIQDAQNRHLAMKNVSLYDPEENRVLQSISIDSRVGVLAQFYQSTSRY